MTLNLGESPVQSSCPITDGEGAQMNRFVCGLFYDNGSKGLID